MEAQPFEDDAGAAKHWAALWLNAGAGIGGPDDGADIELDGVTQPAVGPTAKDE